MTAKARLPSPSTRRARAEARRPKRHILTPDQRGPGGSRQRPALQLPELVLPVGIPLEEHAVTLAQAGELTGTSWQNWHQRIETGAIRGYLHHGIKHVLLADLAESHAGRRQARQVAEEDRRQSWLAEHQAGGSCIGRGCEHWAHERVKRPCSPKLAAHLARIRAIAEPINQAKRAAQLADIEQVKNRIAAEMAGEQEPTI